MSLTEWFKRLFSPTEADDRAEDLDTMRAEYGEGGLAGLARVEDAKAREEAPAADEPPSDAAP